jgi:hypothetical protein
MSVLKSLRKIRAPLPIKVELIEVGFFASVRTLSLNLDTKTVQIIKALCTARKARLKVYVLLQFTCEYLYAIP